MSGGRDDAREAHARSRRKKSARAVRRSDAAYYQLLHDTNSDYQLNNWLIEELPTLRAVAAGSILEVGCGNGLFLAHAVDHWREVAGIDWVRSPVLDRVLRDHPSISFLQQDLTALQLDRRFDVTASADVLEHLPPAALPEVIRRLNAAADVGYHKIACYDDGHSHLSIFDAPAWLRVFQEACPGAEYRIIRRAYRELGRKKAVAVISNLGQHR